MAFIEPMHRNKTNVTYLLPELCCYNRNMRSGHGVYFLMYEKNLSQPLRTNTRGYKNGSLLTHWGRD